MNNNYANEAPPLPKSPGAFALYFIKKYRWGLALMALLEILQKSSEILVPYAFKELLDTSLSLKEQGHSLSANLNGPITFFVIVSLGTLLFARASGALLVVIGPSMRKYIRSTIYQFLQHHSHSYFISHFAGSLANRINELAMSLNHGLWVTMFDFLPVTISFSVSLYLLQSAHASLALYLGGWVFIYVVISFLLAKKCRHYAKNFAAERSRTTGHIVDAVTNVMNTKLFANLGYERERLDKQLTEEVSKARTTFWFMEKMRWFQFTAAFVLQLGLILYALKLFRADQITVGQFAMVASLGLLIINDARGLSRRFLEFFEYLGNVSDGVGIFIKPHDVRDIPKPKELVVRWGGIQLKDVHFSYNSKAKVFDGLNLRIPAGQKVGLVGYSGSGKSTFANLLLRLFDIQKGEILIDGQNIATHSQESLRRQISMIPQDPMLFHRSLRENIRYGKLNASDAEVERAALFANAHEFIRQVPEGYNALVGERGVKLSGGQRQRIAIARAVLKDAPILILDEATSSLDSVTEKAIQNTLENIMNDRTVIIIAHRLSTISSLDRILVFHHGKIIEDGSHSELILKDGHYAKLWSMQAGGFLPEHETQTRCADTFCD